MSVKTLKEAWLMGWRVRVKCNTADAWKEAHRNKALSCHYTHELDMKTLVWTPGRNPGQRTQQAAALPGVRKPNTQSDVRGAQSADGGDRPQQDQYGELQRGP
jgi:hypothetical protein